MNNNGRAIERAILIIGFVLQISALVFSYGRMSGKVDGLTDRIGVLEQRVNNYFDPPSVAPRRTR